jgi:hypothetical protein
MERTDTLELRIVHPWVGLVQRPLFAFQDRLVLGESVTPQDADVGVSQRREPCCSFFSRLGLLLAHALSNTALDMLVVIAI